MTAPPSKQPRYPQPGDVLEGKYEVQRVLGTGAMGAVIRATHLLRKAPVALKFMSPALMGHQRVVQRFLNEGVAASQIDSDHVVKILDVSRLPSGVPYIVMEYLEGEDLSELLAHQGQPGLSSVPRVVHFALQALRGLQVAHRAGIVHRDMKPANCFVIEKNGEPDFLKIVDFGISKLTRTDALRLTQGHAALGTPLYMSPEQARNPANVDARSDLYAVAVIVYELLSGVTPYRPESGTFSELLMQLATDTPAALDTRCDGLPVGLSAIVDRGLAKEVETRYQSAAEMAEALAAFADARSDQVLRHLLQRTPAGVSRFPPAPGSPTEVDVGKPAAGGTVVMESGADDGGPQAEAAPAADSHTAVLLGSSGTAGAADDSAEPPRPRSDAAEGPAVGADTAQGTVREALQAGPRAGRGRISLALGVAALVVLAAVWFGRGSVTEGVDEVPGASVAASAASAVPEQSAADAAAAAGGAPARAAASAARAAPSTTASASAASSTPKRRAVSTSGSPRATAPPGGSVSSGRPRLGTITIED